MPRADAIGSYTAVNGPGRPGQVARQASRRRKRGSRAVQESGRGVPVRRPQQQQATRTQRAYQPIEDQFRMPDPVEQHRALDDVS